jgi:lipopolysaccharide biosynthesis glycosyltransferase
MAVTDNYLGRSLQNWNRFNTGVMLMRLDIIRNISIGSETVVRAIENNRESKWADLEVFNELYAHKWSEISAVYNFMINGSDSLKPSDRALAIIHFAGLPKPWQIDSDSIVDYLWRYFAKLALEGNISENDVFREFTIRSVIMEIVRITPELSESHRGKSVHAYFALEESFESRLQTLEFELSENMVRIAEIQRENESLSLELDEQKNQNVNLNAELDAILNSAIWRISKPYRNLKNLIFGI